MGGERQPGRERSSERGGENESEGEGGVEREERVMGERGGREIGAGRE